MEGGVALGHKLSIKNTKSSKWCYDRCPLIYEVRRGTWWPKCIKCMERILSRLRRTSPEFSLQSHQKRSKRIFYLRWAYPCSEKVKHVLILSTSRSNMYTGIKKLKVHNGSSNRDKKSTCLNITHKKTINDAEGWSWSLMSKTDPNSTKWTWWNKWYYIATRMPTYKMSLWRTITYKVDGVK